MNSNAAAIIPPLDAVVLLISVCLWLVFGFAARRPQWSKFSIGGALNAQRLQWMRQLANRENRTPDSNLIANVMHSVSFFAWGTVVLLGGTMAMMGSIDRNYDTLRSMTLIPQMSRELFEIKIIFLGLIFIYSFLKFSWSLRQFNYFCVFVGAAPEPEDSETDKQAFARRAARLLELGAQSFNEGLRGYYFALAALGWFLHPLAFLAANVLMILVLVRRQFFSKTHDAMYGS